MMPPLPHHSGTTKQGDYIYLGAQMREYGQACADAERARLIGKAEPIAWMWQHEETGRIGFVEAQQVESGMWEIGNPRLRLIRPLYTTPPKQTNPAEIEGTQHE